MTGGRASVGHQNRAAAAAARYFELIRDMRA